jgi:hypothetical protein
VTVKDEESAATAAEPVLLASARPRTPPSGAPARLAISTIEPVPVVAEEISS